MSIQNQKRTGKIKLSLRGSSQLEEGCPYVKWNERIEGPILKVGICYIFLFLISVAVIAFLKIEMTKLQQLSYYSFFGIFIIFVWLVFEGLLLRNEE
jgi:hypothetical protein